MIRALVRRGGIRSGLHGNRSDGRARQSPGCLERFSLRIIRVLAGSLESNGGACEGSCTSPAKPGPTKESCKAKAAALDYLRWNCVVSLPHSLVLMEDGRGTATALYGTTTQPSPTLWPAYCHLRMARSAVPRPQKPRLGETDDLQNCYGFLASADRSPSKKGMLSGLPDSSAQDQAAWPLSPIQIGRVFAHRHPGSATGPTLRPRSWRAAAVAAVCSVCAFHFRSYS